MKTIVIIILSIVVAIIWSIIIIKNTKFKIKRPYYKQVAKRLKNKETILLIKKDDPNNILVIMGDIKPIKFGTDYEIPYANKNDAQWKTHSLRELLEQGYDI